MCTFHATEFVRVSAYMRQLTSFRIQVVKQVTFYKSTWPHFSKVILALQSQDLFIWQRSLGLIYSGSHTAFLCLVLTSRYVHGWTQKLLLCFWKCHPKHTVLWKPCSVESWSRISEWKLTKIRQTREGLLVWKGKWSGAASSFIKQRNKPSTETVLKLWGYVLFSFCTWERMGVFLWAKVMSIAMKQELSISVCLPVFYQADIMIRPSLWKQWWWQSWGDHGLFLAMYWTSCPQGVC